jgi:hypothetical protein
MRVRRFGHHIPLSIAMLAALEVATVFCALVASRFLHIYFIPHAIDDDEGSVWARGLPFAGATFACTMAFGLYSARQRARMVGVIFRLVASVGAGVVAIRSSDRRPAGDRHNVDT